MKSAHTAVAEDQSPVPRDHIRQLTTTCNSSPKRLEREDKKVWDQEVFYKLHLSCKLIKKHSIISTFPGEKWVVRRSYPKVERSQQEANQTCCTRGTQGISRTLQVKHMVASELITSRSTLWEELGSLDLKPQLPQGPGPKPLLAQPSIFLVQKRSFVPSPCIRPQGKSRLISQSNYQQILTEDVPLLGPFWEIYACDISSLADSLCFPKTHPNKS